jgi:hypothetical protein
MIEVRAKYSWGGSFYRDEAAHHAAGRVSDFAGCGFGERDLGWVCKSEFEAEKIRRALAKIGLSAEIFHVPPDAGSRKPALDPATVEALRKALIKARSWMGCAGSLQAEDFKVDLAEIDSLLGCRCLACDVDGPHASDCAVHNLVIGKCDCALAGKDGA